MLIYQGHVICSDYQVDTLENRMVLHQPMTILNSRLSFKSQFLSSVYLPSPISHVLQSRESSHYQDSEKLILRSIFLIQRTNISHASRTIISSQSVLQNLSFRLTQPVRNLDVTTFSALQQRSYKLYLIQVLETLLIYLNIAMHEAYLES